MPTLDIFNDDAFSVSSLTASVNEMAEVPGQLGAEGLFQEDGISTTTLQIEKQGDNLKLVKAGQRGGSGQNTARTKRTMIPFNLVHLPQEDAILADTIQNKRAFGSETEMQSIQAEVNGVLEGMKRNNDATLEWQRMGALKGKILDADGTTVLEDVNARFGITQATQAMALSTATTKVRNLIVQKKRATSKLLGSVLVREWRCKCSATFFDKLVGHDEVKAAYDNWQKGAALRGDMSNGFMYGDVMFEVYDATVDGQDFIDAGSAYLYPVGVPGMFITRFGPADYMETVNTKGLPYYAKQEVMKYGKGVDLELQSNTISINTRPKGVVKLTA
jgi:hypothetical protein